MAEIEVTRTPGGGAHLRLADAEIRHTVALDGLEEAEAVPALESIVLHFDHYGRLAAIDVTADSALAPGLLD